MLEILQAKNTSEAQRKKCVLALGWFWDVSEDARLSLGVMEKKMETTTLY